MRRRWIRFREALCICGFMKTCACCSLCGGASAVRPMVCTLWRKTALGSVGLAARRCTACFDVLEPKLCCHRLLRCHDPRAERTKCCRVRRASAQELAASHAGTKLKNIEHLHCIFATHWCATVHSPNATVHDALFIGHFGCLRTFTQQSATVSPQAPPDWRGRIRFVESWT